MKGADKPSLVLLKPWTGPYEKIKIYCYVVADGEIASKTLAKAWCPVRKIHVFLDIRGIEHRIFRDWDLTALFGYWDFTEKKALERRLSFYHECKGIVKACEKIAKKYGVNLEDSDDPLRRTSSE